MKEKKERLPVWLYPSTVGVIDYLMPINNSKSRSDYIEDAVLFYSGYLTAIDKSEFIPEILESLLVGTVESSENRIAKLLFKNTVELNMLMQIILTQFEITDDMFGKLRGQAVDDVKRTNGNISLKKINRNLDVED